MSLANTLERASEKTPPKSFERDVIAGLSKDQKTIPSKWLYDARGSELFDEITELEEYYPTRTELALLPEAASAMSKSLGPGAKVIEFGSGSGIKPELLIASLAKPACYVGIEISASALEDTKRRLTSRFPNLTCQTFVGDFTTMRDLPIPLPKGPSLGFFPGSTIGNFKPSRAAELLKNFFALLGPNGRLLLGVDLQKDLDVLLPAYDDADGVTANFNLNLLDRINRELDGNFDLSKFRHEARYNKSEQRIEMHIVSDSMQTAKVKDTQFSFYKGETIHTENSYKYTIGGIEALAKNAGLYVADKWIDDRQYFGLFELRFCTEN